MSIVAPGQQPLNKGITLATRKGTSISNCQVETDPNDDRVIAWGKQFCKLYSDVVKKIVAIRNGFSGYYNCHGLVFAARRTWVDTSKEINKILEEDCYEVVDREKVLPGDVILYYGENGEIEHSGIVVSKPDRDAFFVPLVVSKWGRWYEVVHWANSSPYRYEVKFFRVTA